jgi:hypothetical protein
VLRSSGTVLHSSCDKQVHWTAKLPVNVLESLSAETEKRLGLNVTANAGAAKTLPYLANQFPGQTTETW